MRVQSRPARRTTSRQRSLALMFTGVTLVAFVAAACSSSSSGTSSSKTGTSGKGTSAEVSAKAVLTRFTAAPKTIPVTTPLTSKPPAGKSLVVLTPAGVPNAQVWSQGIKAAEDAIGWHYQSLSYDQSNPATLNSALNTALIKNASATAVLGISPSQVAPSTIAAYKNHGVPIIISYATGVTRTSTVLPANADKSYAAAAAALASWFVVDSHGKGKALIANVQGPPALKTFANDLVARIRSTCSSCAAKVVPIPIGTALSGGSPQLVVSSLRANSAYKYVLYDEGSFASGITSALASAGLNGIKVGGSDYTKEQAAAVGNHTQAAWTALNAKNVGYTAVDVALRYLEHLPLTEDSTAQPTQLITRDNISGTSTPFNEPTNALAQWKKLWLTP